MALQNIRAARAFIARDNPAAAKAVVERIIEVVESLVSLSPRIGREGRVAGTRELVVSRTPYTVVYSIGADRIYVLAVLHHAQDWPESL
jgi:toxin ParE1/3/4